MALLNTTQHKNILLQILKDIYTDSTLGPLLGFKGGTAATLFYNLPRFSVDLDFDLLDGDKAEYVFSKVEELIKNYGTIKRKTHKRYTLFLLLSYDDRSTNIKVEINTRAFGSKYELKNYLGISMLVMNQADMAAHKLVAMMERLGDINRDIFDVWYFLKERWDINHQIVERRTSLSFNDFLQKAIDALEKFDDTAILAGMGELLDNKQKSWVKAHLIEDTIFQLRARLEVEKQNARA